MSEQLKSKIQKIFTVSCLQDFAHQQQISILMKTCLILKAKPLEQTLQAILTVTPHFLSLEYSNGQKIFARLDFSLRFQPLLQHQNILKSQKIGFKLLRSMSDQYIQFYHQDYSVIEKLIKIFKTKINQLGFHQYFKAIRKLGKGQFATVFEVQNFETGHKYAVKGFSKISLTKIPKGWESLMNQIKIMRSYSHKNLQKLECVYQTQNSIYLVTQLLKGGTLFDRLQKFMKQNRKIDIQNIRQFMKGMLDGLSELSKLKIVHRDLKLDNIIFRNRQNFQPVIIDFGLATFVNESEYLFFRCGTPGFVSPQVMNSTKQQKIQPVSDIFSLGAIFHYILTQKPIFDGITTQEVLKSNRRFNFNFQNQIYDEIDLQAMGLLQKMMVINPQKRIKANQALIEQFFNPLIKLISPVATTICQTQNFILDQLKF